MITKTLLIILCFTQITYQSPKKVRDSSNQKVKEQLLIDIYIKKNDESKLLELLLTTQSEKLQASIKEELNRIVKRKKEKDSIEQLKKIQLSDSLTKWKKYAEAEKQLLELLNHENDDIRRLAYEKIEKLYRIQKESFFEVYFLKPLLIILKSAPILFILFLLFISLVILIYHKRTKGSSLKINDPLDHTGASSTYLSPQFKSILSNYHSIFSEFYSKKKVIRGSTNIPYLITTSSSFPYETFLEERYAKLVLWILKKIQKEDFNLKTDLIGENGNISEVYVKLSHRGKLINQWNFRPLTYRSTRENFKDFAFIIYNFMLNYNNTD